jgi:CRP-like cAMP-binding protein
VIDLQSLLGILRHVSFFINMSESSRKEIVFAGQVLHAPAGSILFREGDPASGLFVLLEGQVCLSKVGLQGLEYIVHIIKPVVMFNEVTVIDGKPNPVTAVADEDCTTWQISPDSFNLLLQRYPELGIGLAKVLASRSRLLLTNYEDLKDRPVLARTAKLLFTLSECGRKSIDRYENSNLKIAALASTVPEAISRSLKNLKGHGVIETTRAQIKVLSPGELMNFARIEHVLLEYSLREPAQVDWPAH